MKHFITLLLMVVLLFPIECYSDTGGKKPPTPPPPAPKEKKTIPILRYKDSIVPLDNMDRTDAVSAYIEDGIIHISFEYPEGTATVQQIENGMTTLARSYISTFTEARISLVYSMCPVQLFIRTSVGNEYEGWIMPDE